MGISTTLRKSRALDRLLVMAIASGGDMPGEVRGLSETVRAVKAAMLRTQQVGDRAQSSAKQLHSTLDQVESMTQEMDAANRELQSELSTLSNGGPPLEGHPPSVAR